jgi:CubicO group peptidase (beta-lactamase class C family)
VLRGEAERGHRKAGLANGLPNGKRIWRQNVHSHETAEDLIRFAQALRSNKLLSPELTRLVMASKVNSFPDEKYAYGFSEASINDHPIVGHGGGFPGISSRLDIFTDLGYDVAVMANYDPPAAAHVTRKLRSLLCRT